MVLLNNSVWTGPRHPRGRLDALAGTAARFPPRPQRHEGVL